MVDVNKTKVVATVGPGCWDGGTLGRMVEAGVDVFRLNFSHGTLAEHGAAVRGIRAAAEKAGAIVGILGDLCGPKIRVTEVEAQASADDAGDSTENQRGKEGEDRGGDSVGGRQAQGGEGREGDSVGHRREEGIVVREGDSIVIRRGDCASTAECLCTSYDGLVDDVAVGHRVLIDDGQVRLRCVEKEADALVCRCETDGVIRSRKGINLPDTRLSRPSLTEKDRADLAWAVEQDVDFVALSFVSSGEDLVALRRVLKEHGSAVQVVSKIERPQAVERIDEIIELSDVVLIARGDLGVEMDVSKVPLIQKDITRRCAAAGKPVIVATQMLQSMVDSPVPTRAEVSDVANAILDGADAVMLSAETSVGRYPVEALRVIRGIADETEAYLARQAEDSLPRVSASAVQLASAVAHGASMLARDLNLRAIVVWTSTGTTVRLLSKRRPPQMIVGLAPDARVCRWMALYYGVRPVLMEQDEVPRRMVADVDRALLARGLVAPNDMIAIVGGTRLRRPGATNFVLVHWVGTDPRTGEVIETDGVET